MSYDLGVYSPVPQIVLKEQLKAAIALHGWRVVFLQREVGSIDGTLAAPEGAMEDGNLVLGWRIDDSNAALFERTVTARDSSGLKQLAETTNSVAGCVVYITVPCEIEEHNVRLVEEQDTIDRTSYGPAIRAAQSYYHVTTAAGRSPLSFDFQRVVWWSIGQVTGGLVEDPQEGAFHSFQGRSPTEYSGPVPEAGKLGHRSPWVVWKARLSGLFGHSN